MASLFELTNDSFTLLLDKGELGFGDAVAISGIDARQLRNGLDRGTLKVGKKLRLGRWAFTMRDCFHLLIIAQLTSRTWMPISQASEVAALISPLADSLWEEVYMLGEHCFGAKPSKNEASDSQFIIFHGDDGLRVLVHRRGERWGFYELNGTRTELKNWLAPHIRIPVVGLVSTVMTNYVVALGSELPPGAEEAIRRDAEINRSPSDQGDDAAS